MQIARVTNTDTPFYLAATLFVAFELLALVNIIKDHLATERRRRVPRSVRDNWPELRSN
jgi:hypothetical protein